MRHHKLAVATLAVSVLVALAFAGNHVLAERPTRLTCNVWPPYAMQTGDDVSGLSVEITRAVYARLGVRDIEVILLPWMRAMEMVRFGEADGLLNVNHTPERAIFYRFPDEPLVETPWNIWTRKGMTIRSLEELKGKKIGVVLGYAYTAEFWDFILTHCIVEEVYSDKINFRKLAHGRLDATVADLGNALALAAEVKVGLQPGLEIKRDGLYLAFNRSRVDEGFVTRFADALREFKTTEAYTAICEKYLAIEP